MPGSILRSAQRGTSTSERVAMDVLHPNHLVLLLINRTVSSLMKQPLHQVLELILGGVLVRVQPGRDLLHERRWPGACRLTDQGLNLRDLMTSTQDPDRVDSHIPDQYVGIIPQA